MQLENTAYRFGWVSRLLHWTSVTLVAALYFDISGLDAPPKVYARAAVVHAHAVLGAALLIVMLARLVWRARSVNPVLSYRLAPWHRALAITVHRALYTVVVTLCVLGIVAAYATGPGIRLWARALHHALADALLLLVTVHATTAVFNQALGVVAAPRDGA